MYTADSSRNRTERLGDVSCDRMRVALLRRLPTPYVKGRCAKDDRSRNGSSLTTVSDFNGPRLQAKIVSANRPPLPMGSDGLVLPY
jgi:hypothetical protein